MSIRDEVKLFDGKHTDMLEEILPKHRPTSSFIGSLVTLITDEEPNIQTGATWLLKSIAENQVRFKPRHLIALFASLSELTHWLSKLHACQMLQYVAIPDESARNVVWFLERNLWDENRFLRAWSYNGFYELARQHPKYITYAKEQLERGEADKAPSVKARIRNIRKVMNKLPREKSGRSAGRLRHRQRCAS
jgi:hypothetical protein